MNERTIYSWSGQRLVLRADVDDAVMEWGAKELATHAARSDRGVIVDGSGLVLGGIHCAFVAEGDGLALTEADLSAPHSPDVPDTYVPGATRALVLAHEQSLVHASYRDVPPLRANLFHGMRVAVAPGWDRPGGFTAFREPELSLASHSGWVVRRERDDDVDREVSVRDVIERRPLLRRFLTWAPGTSIQWTAGFVYVSVERGTSLTRVYATKGSYVDQRLDDARQVTFDPIVHARWLASAREQPERIASLADRIAEEELISSTVARSLTRDIRRHIAADQLYVAAFARRIRQWLGQGREAIVLQEIARVGELTPEEAKAFLDRHRAPLADGKIPPRD